MKNYMKAFALLCVLSWGAVCQGQLLQVNGQKIVNSSNGQEVLLNAVNLGNWMVMEGYLMGSGDAASYQHDFKAKLRALIGDANTTTFYNAWLNNYVTQADINQIKAWGFNAVRLPLHYEYFTSLTQDVWYNQGFALVDNVIAWCKAAGIYAVLDLHAAPGGQGTGDICDYDNTKPSLWESDANKDKTVALWKKLSERYKNEAWVAGYDLINETHWKMDGNAPLANLYKRITSAIRSNGDNHILFIEGNWYGNDFTGLTPAWDANMVYSFHKYWSYNDKQTIQGYLDLRSQQNRPLWCGETGENSNSHFTMTMELFKDNNIGSSWWPLKKFESVNCFASANKSSGYQAIIDYWKGTGANPGATAAFNTMMQLAENIKLANCQLKKDVVRAIIVQPGNHAATAPYTDNYIPGTIYAPNYDMGYQDYTYWDEVWEDYHISSGPYTAWNTGWMYRNDGVDIQACTDAQSNGYSVGWINPGEWTQYTANVQASGKYKIEVRVANGGSNATLQVKDGASTVLATLTIPSTGGWSSWATYSIDNVVIKAGSKPIRIYCASGGYNFASVKFTLVTPLNDAPVGTTIWLQNSGKYVTSNNGGAPIACDRTAVDGWEKFEVVDAGNSKVALKGSNGMYVSSENGASAMTCTRTSYSDWEKFDWIVVGDHQVALRGNNGMYVSSENGATSGMNCNRGSYQGWEVFTWGSDLSKSAYAVTGISSDVDDSNIGLYPNPCSETLFIKNIADEATVSIYDMNGRLVVNKKMSSDNNSIDVSALIHGVYMVKVLNANSVNTFKVIKK
jgi:hypothetical protein